MIINDGFNLTVVLLHANLVATTPGVTWRVTKRSHFAGSNYPMIENCAVSTDARVLNCPPNHVLVTHCTLVVWFKNSHRNSKVQSPNAHSALPIAGPNRGYAPALLPSKSGPMMISFGPVFASLSRNSPSRPPQARMYVLRSCWTL